MAYIGKSIESGTFAVLDTSGNTYNGSNTTFSLGTQVGSAAQLLVSHDGVIQKPGTDYSLASGGTQITFSTAPASGASIFIVEISGAVGGPLDSDLNGSELILDTDGDTSITADTDDQIDFKVANADQIKLTDGVLAPSTDNDVDLGTSSLEFKDAFFDGTVTTDGLTVSGTPSFADGSIAIADLDIDGGTDIGADIVDADLFIIDDGAGGTNRKVAASRIKTYAGGGLVLLHNSTSTSATSAITVSNVFSDTYDRYLLELLMSLVDGSGNVLTSYYQAMIGRTQAGNDDSSDNDGSSDGFRLRGSGGNSSGRMQHQHIILNGPTSPHNNYGGIMFMNRGFDSSNNFEFHTGGGFITSATDAVSVKFSYNTGNINVSSITIYGMSGTDSY
jgi:hypothetical protein